MLSRLISAASNLVSRPDRAPHSRYKRSTETLSAHLLSELRDLASLHRKLSSAKFASLVTSYRKGRLESEDFRIPLSVAMESLRRTLSIEPYDSQLIAATGLIQGKIVQLGTGEGKTLVAMLAAVHHAFHDRSCHVMTVNGYLASRDVEQLRPVFDAIGLTAGLTQPGMPIEEKTHGYQADVVYGPGFEFGFDYLRDRLAESSVERRLGDKVLRRWRFDQGNPVPMQNRIDVAIIDEADSVMLDEATTPLILSTSNQLSNKSAAVYLAARESASKLTPGTEFRISSSTQGIEWSDLTAAKALSPPRSVVGKLERTWTSYVEKALMAEYCLQRDVDYVVQDDRIRLIDRQTGRIMAERTWSSGLQQAVEAKEELTISGETRAAATISRQRYLRQYRFLSGSPEQQKEASRNLERSTLPMF